MRRLRFPKQLNRDWLTLNDCVCMIYCFINAGLRFALAVATNIETDAQTQPKDALCFAYNAVAGLITGQDIQCTYQKASYYGGGCNCTEIVDDAVV